MTEITDQTSQPISDSEIGEVTSATPSSSSSPPVKPKPLSPKYLWHLRLAHASTSVISKIPTIKSTFDSSNCESCIRAKMHKRPFPKSNFKATQKLQCIHSDLSGPHILSVEKKKWYITFMCDFTRYKWSYALPSKKSKHVFEKIREWVL